jgi:hypothetical protein
MKKMVLGSVALAVCFTGTSLFASTIFSENFESATPGLSQTSAGQFTAINGTNIDVVAASNGWGSLVVAPESGNVVDLGGSGGNSYGDLQSSVITLKPGSYDFSFDLVGSQRGITTTTDVFVAPVVPGTDLYSNFFTLGTSDKTVTNALLTVGTTEQVTINFVLTETGNPNIGSLLDNVEITSTPEPSSLLLLGSGLVALAGFARRKFGTNNA